MEATAKFRRVADVMQPRSRLDDFGVIAEHHGEPAGLRGYTLRISPTPWKWDGEKLVGDCSGPLGLRHASRRYASTARRDGTGPDFSRRPSAFARRTRPELRYVPERKLDPGLPRMWAGSATAA